MIVFSCIIDIKIKEKTYTKKLESRKYLICEYVEMNLRKEVIIWMLYYYAHIIKTDQFFKIYISHKNAINMKLKCSRKEIFSLQFYQANFFLTNYK